MSHDATLKRILDGSIVAVVRAESSESLVGVVKALAEGGVTAAEITFTVPDAVEVIRPRSAARWGTRSCWGREPFSTRRPPGRPYLPALSTRTRKPK